MAEKYQHTVYLAVQHALQKAGTGQEAHVLAGVSGGADSMTLLDILADMGYAVAAAHVNFRLRGREADEDARLVERYCAEHHIPFLLHEEDTKAYAARHKLNTQSAAREIRYQWWNELVDRQAYDIVVTAHHLDDSIETVFINLLRGTGIKGLRGIPLRRGAYVRPMLGVSRQEIEAYAHTFDIPYRTDASNLADSYLRNRLRHHLLPLLSDLAPGFRDSMRHTLSRMEAEWNTWDHYYHQWCTQQITQRTGGYTITCEQHDIPFLLRWLEEKGLPWNLSADYMYASDHATGKLLRYDGILFSRTREGYSFEIATPDVFLVIHQPGIYKAGDVEWHIEICSGLPDLDDHDPSTAYISGDAVRWPLTIRHVMPGDRFQPFGMDGRSKKLQDFMTDQKMEMYEKTKLQVVANPDHILWVAGHRLDERARVKKGDRLVYRLSVRPAGQD